MLLNFVFVFLFWMSPYVQGAERQPCDMFDVECTTKTIKRIYKLVIAGDAKHNIPHLDPLLAADEVDIVLPSLKYNLDDISLHGTLGCEAPMLKLNATNWLFGLMCPQLTLKSKYELNGYLNNLHLKGRGRSNIEHYNYYLQMQGNYENYNDADGKAHMNVTNFEIVKLDVQGKAVFNFTNLFNGDDAKSKAIHHYLNENWKDFVTATEYPIMRALFKQMFYNVNRFHNLYANSDVFYNTI